MKISLVHTRNILLLFLGFLTFQSCTKSAPEIPDREQKPEPEKVPDATKASNYVYSSERQLEFSLYQNDALKSSFGQNEQEKNFKNRPRYFRPQTIIFKEDSLFISKLGGYTESYKIKWEKEKLFIYGDQARDWKHFASKNDKDELLLNIVLYNSQIKSENSNALRTGQLYNPLSINEILSEKSRANMTTIWLKIETIYVAENKKP
ncbi:hypothetical protein ACR78Z_10605 [Sphingobacterium thalpophilum]|uniref:Lipoprotein n=1 Tax=Sphingobacterium thalpophilum TaxID=259 RepID=A0A4U9VEA1_9SPHI|nr:hypothetical protein [Sphingobacterium thalpophilum]VTR41331.1 Uncharacterised protein [Sphingobacterium thalpophilum]